MQKFKLLIIPSWYYAENKPAQGSFFLEQAKLFTGNYDVRILYGYPDYYGKKTFYKIFLPLKKIDLTPNYKALTPPKTYFFKFSLSTLQGEKARIRRIISSYKKYFRSIIKSGWIPDLIHAHSSVYGGIITREIAREFKIPYIITEHQHFIINYFTTYQFKLAKKALEKADKVLAVSKYESGMILMNDIDCNPIVVGNLVNENVFKLSENPPNKLFTILTIGFQTHLKDMKTFFKSIKELVNNNVTDFEAIIISPKYGGVLFDYEEYTDELDIKNYCTFIEEVDRLNIANYFQKCDVFVSTALAETFGVSIAEALSCGKPVIVTNSGGINDFVENEQNGYIIDIQDYKSIANRIVKIKNKELNFSPAKSNQDIINKFGQRAFYEKISNIYNSLLVKNGNN